MLTFKTLWENHPAIKEEEAPFGSGRCRIHWVLEGQVMVKKICFMLLGAVVIFMICTIIMKPLNIWYGDTFLGGEDHSARIFWFNVYVLWPVFIFAGSCLGHRIHKRYLAGDSGRS